MNLGIRGPLREKERSSAPKPVTAAVHPLPPFDGCWGRVCFRDEDQDGRMTTMGFQRLFPLAGLTFSVWLPADGGRLLANRARISRRPSWLSRSSCHCSPIRQLSSASAPSGTSGAITASKSGPTCLAALSFCVTGVASAPRDVGGSIPTPIPVLRSMPSPNSSVASGGGATRTGRQTARRCAPLVVSTAVPADLRPCAA